MNLLAWLSGRRKSRRFIDIDHRLRVVSAIGQGGFAHADLVLDRQTGRFYVAKRSLHPDRLDEGEAFNLKAELNKALSVDHLNVAAAHPYFYEQEDGGIYILTEFCEGPTLGTLVRHAARQLDVATIARIGAQAARGLQAIHNADLIHGDISPYNLLVSEGQTRIIDFGLASSASAAVTRTAIGTPGFLAPEAGYLRATTRSDLFSLGMVLYHLWARRAPYEITGFFRRSKFSLDLYFSRPRSRLEKQFIDVLRRCAAIDPKERHRSATALARDLTPIARQCDDDWWIAIENRLYRADRHVCGSCELPLPQFAIYCPWCGDGEYTPRGDVSLVPPELVLLPCPRCAAPNATRWYLCHRCCEELDLTAR